MDDQLPPPGQLLLDILTVGGFMLLGLIIWVIAKDWYERVDQWLWKRRRARWDRESRHR